MFSGRRRPFNTDRPVTGENLTGYDERYELPIESGSQGSTFGATQNAAPAQSFNGFGAPPQDLFGGSAFGAPQTESKVATATAPMQDVSGLRQDGQSSFERPMVFALRAFSDMFVYEYSDRFEYYRRTPNGMERCNTEYKQNR